MKRFLFCLFFLAIALNSFATGQDGDVIFINGEEWILLGEPIHTNSKLSKKLKGFVDNRESVTSNWDGYTAYWCIKNEKLCLDSISVIIYDKKTHHSKRQCIPSSDMRLVFKKYYKRSDIIASWITTEIRAAQGNIITWGTAGYERNHEKEQILTIKKGKITNRQTFQNKIAVDGFSFNDIKGKEMIRTTFPLNTKSYPELKNEKRVVFIVKEMRLDSAGSLIDCKIKAEIPHQREISQETKNKLAQVMKESLKKIHPWKTLYVNGEYISEYRNGYAFPYPISE